MKKLLFVTPYFYPDVGGLESYTYNIAKLLGKKFSWEIVVVTTTNNKKRSEEEIDGIKVYRLPMLLKISNTPINPNWYFEIKKIIKKEKPDLINAHSPVPFIADVAALAAGSIPFVLTYHAGTMKKNKLAFDILISFYESIVLKNTIKKATRIICTSNFVRRTILKDYKYKTHIINPGVDISIFNDKVKKRKKDKSVIFVAKSSSMYQMKGLYYLIDAMAKIPNVKLKVIGEKISLKRRNIEFKGVLGGKELAKEIGTSSLLVLPSIPEIESFGMVLIEAMACKVPVVGTKIGGITEVIVDQKDGILVEPESSKALRIAIKKILEDSKFATRVSQEGYKKVRKEFTWFKKTSQTNFLFDTVLNKK